MAKLLIEEAELVSQGRMWVVAEAMEWSSLRSVSAVRTVARMVLEGLEASWRVNSRPRPRLAPVGGLLEGGFGRSLSVGFGVDTGYDVDGHSVGCLMVV